MQNKVYVEAQIEWPKLQESDRDMGNNLKEGSDLRKKIEQMDGQYAVKIMYGEDTKQKMIEAGVPTGGMVGQLYKEDHYKATRGHVNPNFVDSATGKKGVVVGPPKVWKEDDDGVLVEWDFEADGLIGNGSRAVIKLDVYRDMKVTLDALKIVDHVPFVPEASDGSVF